MSKIITLCIMAVIIGSVPVYAADSSNATIVHQIQNMNPNVYSEIKNTFTQIQNASPDIAGDINKLKADFMQQDNLQITDIVKNSDVQNLIVDILQNKNVRSQIHGLIQNKDVQDEINKLMQDKDIQTAANILMQNKEINGAVNEIINGN